MLLPNQRKTIDECVARGEALTGDMSSALHAALMDVESRCHRLSVTLQVERADLNKLQWERDQAKLQLQAAEQLKEQIEKEIDLRVGKRTADLKSQLADAKHDALRWQGLHDVKVEEIHDVRLLWSESTSKSSSLIFELRQLLEQQMKPSFLKRLWWQRAVRRVLKEADRL